MCLFVLCASVCLFVVSVSLPICLCLSPLANRDIYYVSNTYQQRTEERWRQNIAKIVKVVNRPGTVSRIAGRGARTCRCARFGSSPGLQSVCSARHGTVPGLSGFRDSALMVGSGSPTCWHSGLGATAYEVCRYHFGLSQAT